MPLNVFYKRPEKNILNIWSTQDPRMFFDLNQDDYIITDNHLDTSIDITTERYAQGKIHLIFEIFHTYENHHNILVKNLTQDLSCYDNIYMLSHGYDPVFTHERILFNDFMFNRTKAYYAKFPFGKNTSCMHYYGPTAYVDMPVCHADTKKKLFVSPSKVHKDSNITHERIYRHKLAKFMQPYTHLGYAANKDLNFILYPQLEFPTMDSIDELEAQTRQSYFKKLDYNPPHNLYYQNTFISIYGETIEYGTTISPTEKTYDPLYKGHFILPFSTSGFIKYLKEHHGFRFPEFIDYTYDSIQDVDARFKCYTDEIARLLSLDLDTWKQHWNNNLNIIQYNKQLFHDTPYHITQLPI